MRLFELHRDEDETGVSGTGRVCQGVEFDDGTVALHWIVGHHRTHGVYANVRAVEDLHGHGGRTRIVWLDEPVDYPPVRTPRGGVDIVGPRDVSPGLVDGVLTLSDRYGLSDVRDYVNGLFDNAVAVAP